MTMEYPGRANARQFVADNRPSTAFEDESNRAALMTWA
jgi:hypothetical protein